MPNHQANLVAATELRSLKHKFDLAVTATAKHDDQVQELEENGVDAAFNLYAEAGQGYADFVKDALELRRAPRKVDALLALGFAGT